MALRADDGTTGGWLDAAVAAPSVHNTQPWRFSVHDGGIDVRADPARRLRVIDRDHRSMLLSVGAAVFNLRLAIALDGRLPVLRPFPADGVTVARIEPGRPGRPGPGLRALGGAVFRRHTNRGPYARAVVPARVLDELRAAAAAEGAELTALDRVRRDALLALMITADAAQRGDPAYRRELATWTAADPTRRDGIPPALFGPRDAAGRLPLRDFDPGPAAPGRPAVAFEPHPQLVVLSSRSDARAARVRAGQAMQRVLLTATVRGLAVQPMTQVLELPRLRRVVADPADPWFPQMILRIGYALPAPPSPRRAWSEVLTTH
ncbi:nitroreductase family protein [Dactylosporangium aurantiacum]|uniref:Nitroreductase family protein n=1 Tax=Dactylosporangium aurantiacum TaxID=35754 RepID=A0A9Q9IMW4_9ACTN|nr:nitroreductase family protein [Dactylosporangium aurantiacum]MDG6105926.1 nitroreductase family protein [Dactylosporangium aurantiacum]UWZ57903.1 nitroreductase family protein [Dactylosporangium aurantiacum]